jgi:hypothetical protein
LPLAGERGYFSHEVVIHGDMVLNSSREAWHCCHAGQSD